MDILKILFQVGKALLLFGPLVLAGVLLTRLAVGTKAFFSTLSAVLGAVTGLLFYVLALFTRANVPWVQEIFAPNSPIPGRVNMHLPFPNLFDGFGTDNNDTQIKHRFLRLWNDQFSSFWTDVLNPFKAPFSRTLADIRAVPNLNGTIFLAVLVAIGILSVLIAQVVEKSGSKQLKLLGLGLFLGWYVGSLGAWLGPLFGGLIFLCQFIFLLSMYGRGLVVRSGDVVRVQ